MIRIVPLKGVILDHTVIDVGSSPPMLPAAFIEGSESPWSDQPLIDLDSGTLTASNTLGEGLAPLSGPLGSLVWVWR